jgi:hypothetical protein
MFVDLKTLLNTFHLTYCLFSTACEKHEGMLEVVLVLRVVTMLL